MFVVDYVMLRACMSGYCTLDLHAMLQVEELAIVRKKNKMFKSLTWLVVLSIFLCITTSQCGILNAPQSKVIYERASTTLACHVTGTAFWLLNGTVYSYLNIAYFESRGITSFDFFLGGSEVNKTLMIVGSALNNNTFVSCISLQSENTADNASRNATITVLESPRDLTLHKLNSSSLQLTWSESFVPAMVTPQRYSLSIINTSNPQAHQVLQTVADVVRAGDSELYSHVYTFDREPSQCTQITFSVTSSSFFGTSPPSKVTWELAISEENVGELKNSISCSRSDETSLTVSFKPHRLCPFQSGTYDVSILTKDTALVLLKTGTITGSLQPAPILLSFTDQSLKYKDSASASVSISSPYGSEKATTKCTLIRTTPSIPSIGRLDPASKSESDAGGVSDGFIAGISISLIFLVVTVVLLVGIAVYLIKEPTYNLLNKT